VSKEAGSVGRFALLTSGGLLELIAAEQRRCILATVGGCGAGLCDVCALYSEFVKTGVVGAVETGAAIARQGARLALLTARLSLLGERSSGK
jgi:hypothetical protein